MGEARRRGSANERRELATKKAKSALLGMLGNRDPATDNAVRTGIAPFISKMAPGEWMRRKGAILDALKLFDQGTELDKAKSIRYQEDEIAWYLFLCEQSLDDPLCMDVNQLSRAAPFFAGIGTRWGAAHRVKGLDKKLDEAVHKYRKEPDGVIFEISVALAYAAAGWEVELLDEQPPAKSPDMCARRDGVELFVECKRLARRTSYAEQERNDFLMLWDAAKDVLVRNRQWVWFKGMFHVEVSALPADFLRGIFQRYLPIGPGEVLVHDSPEASIYARTIDQIAVHRHLRQYRVKANSPMLHRLLGADWAPLNSSSTIIKLAKTSHVVDCDVPVLGGYIDDIAWACGFTRDFDSPESLDKKAKDITKHLSEAVKQVPDGNPSIIHVAAETLEGKDVERLRTEKVMASIPSFITHKPVLAIRFHRFLANQTIDKLWEFDETVSKFQVDGFPDDEIPLNVVVREGTEMKDGSHWELYP